MFVCLVAEGPDGRLIGTAMSSLTAPDALLPPPFPTNRQGAASHWGRRARLSAQLGP